MFALIFCSTTVLGKRGRQAPNSAKRQSLVEKNGKVTSPPAKQPLVERNEKRYTIHVLLCVLLNIGSSSSPISHQQFLLAYSLFTKTYIDNGTLAETDNRAASICETVAFFEGI